MSQFLLKLYPRVIAILLVVLSSLEATAAVHNVAAQEQALARLLQSGKVQGGDEVVLAAGNHGAVRIQGAKFDSPVIVRPADGVQARATGILIAQSRNLIFDGLQVWPDRRERGHIIKTETNTAKIVFRNIDLRGRGDATSYRSWSRKDWLDSRRTGLLLRGKDSAVLTSRLTGLGSGIGVLGDNAVIEGNRIQGFSHDGIDVAAHNVSVRDNVITDCIKLDDSHDDGIQAWSLGPKGRAGRSTLKNLTIENNTILEWSSPPVHPLVCALQGIGLFDGMFDNLSIRNNVVMVSAFHGISVYGALNSIVSNNTVMHRTAVGERHPWVGLFNHKDGRPPRDVIVANNAAPRVSASKKAKRVTLSQNLQMRYPARYLEAPYAQNFKPKAQSELLGRGDTRYAPRLDILGQPRGSDPAIGAIERR